MMKLNCRTIAALMATTALAFGVPAHAHMGAGCPDHMGSGMAGKRMGGDPAARVEQHLAQFKTELKITPEQEPLWQAFAEKKKADAGKGMAAMREQMQQPMPAPERMTRRIEAMKAHTAAMEGIADSFKRLYEALTPEQKAVADKHVMRGSGMKPGGRQPRQGMGGPASRRPD